MIQSLLPKIIQIRFCKNFWTNYKTQSEKISLESIKLSVKSIKISRIIVVECVKLLYLHLI